MALDLNKIKKQQVETTRSDSNFFKCEEGQNKVRVFTFKHEVTNRDVKLGFFSGDKIGEEVEELARPVVRHFNMGKRPVFSTKETMAEYNKMKREDPKGSEDIKPGKVYFMNVVNMDKPDDGMLAFGCPSSVYNKILGIVLDDDYGVSVLGAAGRDFVITYNPKLQGTEKYQVMPRKEGMSKKLASSWGDQAIDMYDPANESDMADGSLDEPEGGEEIEPDVHAPKKKLEAQVDNSDIDEVPEGITSEEVVEEIFGKKKAELEPVKKKAAPPVEEDDEEVVLEPPKKKKK